MGVLSGAKAEPTDPVRGMINDIIDIVGFPRPEEALGTPADIVHQAGLPTVRDWLPMPVDVSGRLFRGVRQGMPRMPVPPRLEGIFGGLFPIPGEGIRDASAGAGFVAAETGQRMR